MSALLNWDSQGVSDTDSQLLRLYRSLSSESIASGVLQVTLDDLLSRHDICDLISNEFIIPKLPREFQASVPTLFHSSQSSLANLFLCSPNFVSMLNLLRQPQHKALVNPILAVIAADVGPTTTSPHHDSNLRELFTFLNTLLMLPDSIEHCDSATSVYVSYIPHSGSAEIAIDELCQHAAAAGVNKKDAVIQARFLNILAEISGQNSALFEMCHARGLMTIIDNIFRSQDLLTSMVVMDLLAVIGRSDAGARHLIVGNHLHMLLDMAADVDSILASQALRNVSSIILTISRSSNQENFHLLWSTYNSLMPCFAKAVVAFLQSPLEANRISGIRACTDFASSSIEGLSTLLNDRDVMPAWVSLTKKGSVDLQAAVYHSFAEVLESQSKSESSAEHSISSASRAEVDGIVHRFYESIGVCMDLRISTSEFVFRAVRQPIIEVRSGGLHLIAALARFTWGVEAIFSVDGFPAFVTDWHTEFSQVTREWKYLLIKNLTENASIGILQDAIVDHLRLFVSKGPNYVPSRPAGPQMMD